MLENLTLILNAAEGRLQLIVAKDTLVLAATELYAPSNGTELLPPLLADTLKRLDTDITQVQRIACVIGPGSFTGIRLVLTLAAALRRVQSIPVAGINYLQALAADVPCAEGTFVRVLTTARRDKVHAQTFVMGPQNMPIAQAPTPELIFYEGAAINEQAIYIGSGTAKANLPSHAIIAPLTTPSAQALLHLTVNAATWVHHDLEPLYVRPCDAIDNLDHIARQRGQEPAQAHAELQRLLTQ